VHYGRHCCGISCKHRDKPTGVGGSGVGELRLHVCTPGTALKSPTPDPRNLRYTLYARDRCRIARSVRLRIGPRMYGCGCIVAFNRRRVMLIHRALILPRRRTFEALDIAEKRWLPRTQIRNGTAMPQLSRGQLVDRWPTSAPRYPLTVYPTPRLVLPTQA
jgi:hypothetical protein